MHCKKTQMKLILAWLAASLAPSAAGAIAIPTAAQLAWQSFDVLPLRTFHHFDICTFTGCEHNSGTANKSRGSGSPSDFAPTAVNATQWVLAAKALGAGSAVLTARHEGGFALWPTKFSNYSIAHSPYKGGKGDIVMEFVTACRAHGIKPGLYIAGSCDAYHHCGPEGPMSASEYEQRQTGMVEELVSGTYGHIEYLWFDHHGNPVNSTSPFGPWCPHMCDPISSTLWASIDDTVQRFGGTTLRGGADLNIGSTDPPKGDTPLWQSCNTTDGTIHTRPSGAFGPFGSFYRPSEITNMLTDSGWFHHPSTKPKSTKTVLEMIWGSTGRGYSFIGNLPPNTHGVLDDAIVTMAEEVGAAIRGFWRSSVGEISGICTSGDETVTLKLSKPAQLKSVALREDLSQGQKVGKYALEYQTGASTSWTELASRQTIGNLFVHTLPSSATVEHATAVRVRCEQLVGVGTNVSINALSSVMIPDAL
jgi:alpha-L-fucosidase